MKLLIITVMMLSRNQNNREPNDDLPQIVYVLILSPNPSFRSNFRGNGNTVMISGKNPVSYGKSKVMLQLQSKEKCFGPWYWKTQTGRQTRRVKQQLLNRDSVYLSGWTLWLQLQGLLEPSRTEAAAARLSEPDPVIWQSVLLKWRALEQWTRDLFFFSKDWLTSNCLPEELWKKLRGKWVVLHMLNIARPCRSLLGSVCLTLTSVGLSGFSFNPSQHSW